MIGLGSDKNTERNTQSTYTLELGGLRACMRGVPDLQPCGEAKRLLKEHTFCCGDDLDLDHDDDDDVVHHQNEDENEEDDYGRADSNQDYVGDVDGAEIMMIMTVEILENQCDPKISVNIIHHYLPHSQ